MAEIMSKSDLCIGAGGSTSWERCCLGLPTISFAIADNQIGVLAELEKATCTIISSLERISSDLEKLLSEEHSHQLKKLSFNSSKVTDGNGIKLLLEQFTAEIKDTNTASMKIFVQNGFNMHIKKAGSSIYKLKSETHEVKRDV